MAISLRDLQTILWVESTLLRIARQGGAFLLPRRPAGPRGGPDLVFRFRISRKRPMVRILGCVAALAIPAAVSAAGLADISNQDAVSGLKEALTRGSRAAVARLGVGDGFFRNGSVKIALPPSLRRVEAVMRAIGMDRQADDLVLRMNRAAEAAVPRARGLLVDAAKNMSVQDAKGILSGGDDAATQYFKRTTSEPLAKQFLPIVKRAMAKVKAAEKYNEIAASGAKFGLVKEEDANLEDYVTRRALDGLFITIAEEEKKIRQDPAGAASAILKKVFGALRNEVP